MRLRKPGCYRKSMKLARSLFRLSDDSLLADLTGLVLDTNALTAKLLATIAEVDRRRLYLREGCSSMHAYCVERLGLSEGAAYKRIHAARAARPSCGLRANAARALAKRGGRTCGHWPRRMRQAGTPTQTESGNAARRRKRKHSPQTDSGHAPENAKTARRCRRVGQLG